MSEKPSKKRESLMDRPPEMIPLPLRNISGIEAITTGFRACSIECEHGDVTTHGGFGSPFAVTMKWKGRYATIHSVELLAAWVETFSPEDAKAIRAVLKKGEP